MRPREHVRCRTPADVAGALAIARTSGLALAVRSGGHCFAGRSSTEGVLVDSDRWTPCRSATAP